MMSIEGYPRTLRLTQSAQYQAVFEQRDHRIPAGPLLLIARYNQLEHPRIGIIVGKKAVSLAVQRNRVKRLFRESFRCNQATLPAMDIIILARNGLGNLENKAILETALDLWQKLSDQVKQKPNAQVSKNQ